MKLNNNKLSSRLSVYAATAGALVSVIPANTNAQVFYSGEIDTTLLAPDSLFAIDINFDTIPDLYFGGFINTYIQTHTNPVWRYSYTSIRYSLRGASFNFNSSYQHSFIQTTSGNLAGLPERHLIEQTLLNSSAWNYTASVFLGYGLVIQNYRSFSSIFHNTTSSSATIRTHSSATTTDYQGSFFNLGDKYIGLKIEVDTLYYFGWIRVNMPDSGASYITVKDWAYQSAAGRGIFTGVDTIAPMVTMEIDTTQEPLFIVKINFDEEILDTLSLNDLEITNGSIDSLVEIIPYKEYTAYINPDNQGMLVVTIPQSTIKDLWGNTNNEGSVTHEIVTSLTNIDEFGYKVFPNPVVDKLYIELPSEGKIIITDVSGKVILMKEQIRITEMDLSNFNAGIYMVKMQTRYGIATQRVIKN